MHIVTDHIWPDEPCYGLSEGPLWMPYPEGEGWQPGTRRRWVQRVFVIRDDAIAKYIQDIGPAEDYEGRSTPLLVPSFGENSVAELQELAEATRHNHRYSKRREEMLAASTLREDALRTVEMRYLEKQNRTVLGAGTFAQRGNFSREAVERALRDKIKVKREEAQYGRRYRRADAGTARS